MNADLYSEFEEAFRGSRAEIIARLSGYEGLLAECAGHPEPRALDLGCGRGEWLQVLGRHGWTATGIDSNPRFVEQCQALNLHAVCVDAFDYLESLHDHSYSLVSAFHLIEHLSHAQVGRLCSQALRILRPGGLLLLETPSIDHILVATKSFYSDPTHITPIHPEALCFSLRQAGFAWAATVYINGGSETDAGHDQITRLCSGVAQDVCIMASPVMPDVSFREGVRWRAQLYRAPTTLEVLYQYNQALTETLHQLDARHVAADARLIRLEHLVSQVRWWFRPLFVVRRQLRRLAAAVRHPRVALHQAVHATGLTSRRHRPMLSALLKRFGLYHVSLAMYQRAFSPIPTHQPVQLPLVAHKAGAIRARQIEGDLGRLGRRQRGVSR
jgi:SAM-dependent methyltransferase